MNTISKKGFLIWLLIIFTSLLFAKEPNPRISFLKSALLPGWGELSVDHNSGYAFMAAEVLLWSSKFFCEQEKDLLTDQAFFHAVKYAHINPDLHYSDEFLFHLTKYASSGFESGGYNAHIVMRAEELYGPNGSNPDPQMYDEYIQNNIYNEEFYWNWDSESKQTKYNKKRQDATDFNDIAKALTGTIVVNHVLSAINSFRISSKLRKLKLGMYFDREMQAHLTCNYQF